MGLAPLPGLDRPRVQRILSKASARRSAMARMDHFSEGFLGVPYESHPLIGSAEAPEVFTAALEGFDCVTYVETVLALAGASNADGFAERLRGIRYDGGHVAWRKRNHYMTDWIRRNERIGVVRPVSADVRSTRKDRLLDAVPGLPSRRARFKCVPKPLLKKIADRLLTGDLIFFASTKKNLDVFHCGVLVHGGDRWRMRHASRGHGKVIEEDLDDFLKRHRMAGVIVVRPVEPEEPEESER